MPSKSSRFRTLVREDFVGLVAAVTGAGSGIGRATSIELARRGAMVVVADIDERAAARTARYISRTKGVAISVRVDVSVEADVVALREAIQGHFKRLDILVNNAGVASNGSVVDCAPSEWDRVMSTNLRGSYLCSHFMIPLLSRNEHASIVNVGSVQSVVGVRRAAAYVASKFGLLGLTKAMAADHAPGVRVNAVLPGTIDTPLFRKSSAELGEVSALILAAKERHLLKRIGQPREVAEAIAFLASQEAAFITGVGLLVDGGLTAFL